MLVHGGSCTVGVRDENRKRCSSGCSLEYSLQAARLDTGGAGCSSIRGQVVASGVYVKLRRLKPELQREAEP